ncbi:iron-sulfur cluster assembly protein, partial [Bacteroidales bacterium MSK.15.36]|nr:iron-sulfur cluster assembly protein [Bacteroidales bacterium MSK.15.36]
MDKEQIVKALEKVYDPELNRNLVELNMIKNILEEDGNVKIEVALTTIGCPMKNKMEDDIIKEISSLEGVKSVEVKFGEMTEEEKDKLFGQPESLNSFENTTILAIGSGKGG